MMKKMMFLALVLMLGMHVKAQNSGLGLGLILGEPTGLSAKFWTTEKTAVDAAAAWSLVGSGYLRVHADMVVHNYSIDVSKGRLPLYFGLGAKLTLASSPGLGIRVPLGMAYQFADAPFDVFAEIVPVLELMPASGFVVEGAVGIRYFF
ncbi:MAG: hypothetical protein R2751_17290 [Bacteroidales bacterium]